MQPVTYARSLSIPWREASLVGDFEGFLIAKSRLLRRCIAMDEWGWWVEALLLFRGIYFGLDGGILASGGVKGEFAFRFDVVGFCYSNTLSIRRLRGFYDLGIWKRVYCFEIFERGDDH